MVEKCVDSRRKIHVHSRRKGKESVRVGFIWGGKRVKAFLCPSLCGETLFINHFLVKRKNNSEVI